MGFPLPQQVQWAGKALPGSGLEAAEVEVRSYTKGRGIQGQAGAASSRDPTWEPGP